MFEHIVETVREPLLVLDSNLRILFANRSFYDSFRVTPEDTIGNLIYNLGNRQWDIPRLRTLLEDILGKHNKFDDYEVEHIFPGIGQKIMLLNARRINHNEIGSQMILLAFEDITKRKRTEGSLETSEEKFRELVQNVNSIILKMNPEGKVTFFNKFAQEFFEYTEKEMLGRTLAGTIIPKQESAGFDVDFMIKDIEINPEKYVNNENENIRRNGDRVWVAWTNKAMRDRNGKVIEILCIGNDITERRRIENELKDYEERFRRLFETTKDGLLLVDKQTGTMVNANPAIVKMLGYSREECIGKKPQDIGLLKDVKDYKDTMRELIQAGFMNYENVSAETKQGQLIDVDIHLVDRARFIQCNVRDITERKKFSEQLLHSQKMDALGHLVGGIAHDFNNILSGIIAYQSLIYEKMRDDDPLRPFSNEISKLVETAALLTRSLLTYSRKQFVDMKPADINKIVSGIQNILGRLIGEDIEVKVHMTAGELIANVDVGQIEQVLLNLATNARDAMPHGGELNISTEQMHMDNGFIQANGYGAVGNYALLSVADTGIGIDDKTIGNIFEPFFTTKEVGKGTGLGLAMVYGIIKQHNGFVNVYSCPGEGATFKIYLPLMLAKEKIIEQVELVPLPSGTETILLVEDNQALREVAKIFLENYGYKVLEAINGEDAVQVFSENSSGIELIVTDMILPKMHGNEVYKKIKIIKPDIKCLFMSGYSNDIIEKRGVFNEGIKFISKPFSPYDLLKKVRETLDS
jgi:PAS domain S-box-containing protein